MSLRRARKTKDDGDDEYFVSPFNFVTAAVKRAQFYYKSISCSNPSNTKSAQMTYRWRDDKL